MASAALVCYHPVFSSDFMTDDYTFLDVAGRLSLEKYIAFYFDPRGLISWYRPFQGMLWWLEYQLFGVAPDGYHIVNVVIHIANACLIFGLTTRLVHKAWVGLLAGLAFLVLPAVAIDVFWPGVADPQLVLFYLSALWFWVIYLERNRRWALIATFIAFLSTLLTKEMGATLIVTMFLVDRLLIGSSSTLKRLVLRYMPFGVAMIPYVLIEYSIQTRGVYVNFVTYGTGGHSLENLGQYILWLAFPWSSDALINQIALVIIVLALVYSIAIKRQRGLVFLALGGLITVLPVVPFPFAIQRYLYLPVIFSAVFLALGVEFARTRLKHPLWRRMAVPGLMALFVLWNGSAVYESAVNYAGFVHETRLQFKPIFQKHPTFEKDTFLYFFEPPFPTPNISGMMYLKYGPDVSVYGTDRDHIAQIWDHNVSLIYYQDDRQVWQEQLVEKNVSVQATPRQPIRFEKAISLVDYAVANPNVAPGKPIAMILYWQSTRPVDKNYTVFIHLVDRQGHTVTGYDSQPRQGKAPTSSWRVNDLLPDGIVMPIDASVPPGEYQITVGLYDPTTMQRLSVLDANGNPVTDKVVIGPITVEDQVAP